MYSILVLLSQKALECKPSLQISNLTLTSHTVSSTKTISCAKMHTPMNFILNQFGKVIHQFTPYP